MFLGLFILQVGLALILYGRISSFHTYMAKTAAIAQGIFLLLMFFLPDTPYILFYVAAIITIVDLSEEIVLVLILSRWQTDVKGLFRILKSRNRKRDHRLMGDPSDQ